MVKSMTGYGLATADLPIGKVSVEVRCLNHKYFDLSLKLPRGFFPWEPRVRDLVRERIARGRVDVTVKLQRLAVQMPQYQMEPDMALAQTYVQCLRDIRDRLGLGGEVTIDHVAAVREILPFQEQDYDIEVYWSEFRSVIIEALGVVDDFRQREGAVLGQDVSARVGNIKELVEKITIRAPEVVREYQEKLRERLRVLLDRTELDESRFLQEVAFFADRADITEELTRLDSHLDQFAARLEEDSAGRKLDFIVQEMHREVNTIGAKTGDSAVAQMVIEIKSDLGKIREQIQNFE